MNIARLQRRQQSAFTLIELLVVIAIIAILATIAVPVGGKVMERARALQAKATMKGLEIAVNGYRTEYNRMPLAAGASGTKEYTTDASGSALLKTLMAQDNATNPRQIKFYEPTTAKSRANGYDNSTGALYDPWGQPFNVEIDYSGEGLISNPYVGTSGEPEDISSSVIIYSWGADKTFNTKDDVKSWN